VRPVLAEELIAQAAVGILMRRVLLQIDILNEVFAVP